MTINTKGSPVRPLQETPSSAEGLSVLALPLGRRAEREYSITSSQKLLLFFVEVIKIAL